MNYLDVIRKNGGGLYYDRKTAHLEMKNTAYGVLVERFEEDKFDIQLSVIGLENLDKVLKKICTPLTKKTPIVY